MIFYIWNNYYREKYIFNQNVFQINIQVSDQRNPNPKFDTAIVRVTVQRDNSNPRFTNIPITLGIPELSTSTSGIIWNITAEDRDKRVRQHSLDHGLSKIHHVLESK